MTTTQTDDYGSLAAQAESAVSSVKDAELRRIAFEKILEALLGGNTIRTNSRSRSSPEKSRKKRATKSGGVGKRKTGGRGPKALIEELIEDGFFKKPKTLALLKAELANSGHHIPLTSLSGPLQRLRRDKRLRREMKDQQGKKPVYFYSEW